MTETAFQRATPVLKSGDYPASRAFYVDVLGYSVVEEGGDPPRFGIFERGGSVLFVDAWHGPSQPVAGAWDAYIHVSGLAAICAELEARGAPITRPIEDTVYGMREFEVTDPDGNVLCFGEDADSVATA
ncbi:MAG: VOC family protein [Kiloniellales bacterium]|nr:VOC family protein [Kiloniellales bacterium]